MLVTPTPSSYAPANLAESKETGDFIVRIVEYIEAAPGETSIAGLNENSGYLVDP